jgi:TolB-like protein/Flp pilus assembly protein TadD
MAPELLSGGAATERSDLYAVGLILQEALTGRSPVPPDGAQTQTGAGEELAQGSTAPLTEIDEQLDLLICQLTDPSPEKRPTSASAVVERLQRTPSVPARARTHSSGWRAALLIGGLAAVSLAGAWLLGRPELRQASRSEPPAAAGDRRVGVAVLPFTAVGTSPEDQSLVDGIHAELITELSKVRDLRVISRASVVRLATGSENLAELGKRLDVSAIAEGRVRRVGDSLRVHVELADARTGEDLWSERYDRALADDGIFQVESEIAREIAGRVGARLSPEDQARFAAATQTGASAEAGDLYLSARGLEVAGTPAAVAEALTVVRQSLAEDPKLVRAWALSGVLHVSAARWRLLAPVVAYPAARDAARRALELDPDFAEAHAVLCQVLAEYDRDWERADAACLRAIELNPSSERALIVYARLLAARGRREDSEATMTRAWQLDPTSGQAQAVAADIWLHLGDYERAVATAKVAITLAPDLAPPQATLGLAQIRSGEQALGVRTVEQAAELAAREPIALAVLGYAYGLANRTVEAKMILTQLGRLSGERRARSDELFLVQLGLGRANEALDLLAQAIADRSPLVMWLAVSRYFDPLRSDPRFAPLLRETGLVE